MADAWPASKGLETSPVSERTVARPLTAADEPAFIALAVESFEFHRKWIKLPTKSDEFKRYLSKFDGGDAFFFVICDAYSDSIVGFVSLTGIEREPYQRGRLGYGVFERYARKGYISAGLKQVVNFAFGGLKLHRLEADIQSENSPSKRLVKKMGFTCEGVSHGFIRINGEWMDHERWALTSDD
jgi:ribosomal-protein-alanine N-acetyltransferase